MKIYKQEISCCI